MSENNIIYEITKMMNDKPAIQNDMNEAMMLVKKMFEEKYISKINNIVKDHHEKTRKNPSREINLLQAFKAFTPENEQTKIEKLIDSLYMLETLSSINSEYKASPPVVRSSESNEQQPVSASAVNEDCSIHSDGIYEIDNQCITTKENRGFSFLPVFLLMSMRMQGGR